MGVWVVYVRGFDVCWLPRDGVWLYAMIGRHPCCCCCPCCFLCRMMIDRYFYLFGHFPLLLLRYCYFFDMKRDRGGFRLLVVIIVLMLLLLPPKTLTFGLTVKAAWQHGDVCRNDNKQKCSSAAIMKGSRPACLFLFCNLIIINMVWTSVGSRKLLSRAARKSSKRWYYRRKYGWCLTMKRSPTNSLWYHNMYLCASLCFILWRSC